MKRIILFAVLFFSCVVSSPAQTSTVIDDTTYFRSLYVAGLNRVFNKDSLMAVKPMPIPVNFADTLKKYDWLLLQNVQVSTGHMNNFFAYTPVTRLFYNVTRFDTAVSRHLLTLQENSTVIHDPLPVTDSF